MCPDEPRQPREADGFGGERAATEWRQRKLATATRPRGQFADESVRLDPLERAVDRARTGPPPGPCGLLDRPHHGVPVLRPLSQGEEDVEDGGGQRRVAHRYYRYGNTDSGIGQDLGTPAVQPLRIAGVTVSGRILPLIVGETVQLVAAATRTDGAATLVTDEADWQTSDKNIIAVLSQGLVTARGVGAAEVRATFGGMSGKLRLVVVQPGFRFTVLARGFQ